MIKKELLRSIKYTKKRIETLQQQEFILRDELDDVENLLSAAEDELVDLNNKLENIEFDDPIEVLEGQVSLFN